MTDYFLGVVPQSIEWELRSNVQRFPSPLNGVTTTVERVGSRWAATFKWDVIGGERAARLKAFLATQRGGANRFWFYDWIHTLRGSMPVTELLTNPEFASGTTGWTPGSQYVLTAADGVLRMTRSQVSATQNAAVQSPTLTQYIPYAARAHTLVGRGSFPLVGPQLAGLSATTGPAGALRTFAGVPLSTGAVQFSIVDGSSSGVMTGDYFGSAYTSLARCARIDNALNALTRSIEFNDTAWTKTNLTANAEAATAPDGSDDSDGGTETTTNATHEFSQAATVASAAAEYFFGVAVAAGLRDIVQIVMTEGSGSSSASAFFNLTTGAVGTIANGANWTNCRAFSVNLGGGFRYCGIVARKTNAATSINFRILAAQGGEVTSYAGSTASPALFVWRATAAQSSLPCRLVQTGATAAASGTSQTGAALHLKGLPASTDGLLLTGDWVEIITPTYSELKRVTAPLNSDAAGLGYLQFEPILRQSPADSAAVIMLKPMGRFMLDESTVRWSQGRAGVHSCSFTAVEDVAA